MQTEDATDAERACLVIYTRPYSAMPWRARTGLLCSREVREIFAEPGKVCELGEAGTQLRIASFARCSFDSQVHTLMSDREFDRRGVPILSFMSYIQMETEDGQARPPKHLRVASGDGVIV